MSGTKITRHQADFIRVENRLHDHAVTVPALGKLYRRPDANAELDELARNVKIVPWSECPPWLRGESRSPGLGENVRSGRG